MRRSTTITLVLCGLLALLLAPVLPGSRRDPFAGSRNRIASMQADERARLEQNLDNFLAMPRDDQERLRTLDAATESDPKLLAVRDAWNEWLKGLSTLERQQLRSPASTAERLETVRRLREPSFEVRVLSTRRRAAQRVRVPIRDFKAAMETLESKFSERFRKSSPRMNLRRFFPGQAQERLRAQIRNLSDEDAQLLKAVFTIYALLPDGQAVRGQRVADASNPDPDPKTAGADRLADDTAVDEIIACFTVAEVQERLNVLPAALRRTALGRLLLGGLRAVYLDHASPAESRSEELRLAFRNLSDQERDVLMQMPPVEARRRLVSSSNPLVLQPLGTVEQRFQQRFQQLIRARARRSESPP